MERQFPRMDGSARSTNSTVTNNDADGGKGHGGGAAGLGRGGGVDDLGSLTVDVFTLIAHNHASTSNDDVFP